MPHIHKEQVLHDIQNWNKEKEAEYNHRVSEKARLAKLADDRAAEKARLEEEAKQAELARIEEEKRKKREELGSQASEGEAEEEEENKQEVTSNQNESKPEGEGGEGAEAPEGEGGNELRKERQAVYDRQLAQLAADDLDSDDEFQVLDLKTKINKYFEENPKEKKIPSDMMSEAFRWRLSQNDC